MPASVCQGYASPAIGYRFAGSGSERNDGDAEPLHLPLEGKVARRSRDGRGGLKPSCSTSTNISQPAAWRAMAAPAILLLIVRTRNTRAGYIPPLQIAEVLCGGDLRSLDKPHLRVCREACPTLHLLPVAQSSSLALPCQILVSLPASIRSAPSGQVPTGHTLIFSASRGRWHGEAVTEEVGSSPAARPQQTPSNPQLGGRAMAAPAILLFVVRTRNTRAGYIPPLRRRWYW